MAGLDQEIELLCAGIDKGLATMGVGLDQMRRLALVDGRSGAALELWLEIKIQGCQVAGFCAALRDLRGVRRTLSGQPWPVAGGVRAAGGVIERLATKSIVRAPVYPDGKTAAAHDDSFNPEDRE